MAESTRPAALDHDPPKVRAVKRALARWLVVWLIAMGFVVSVKFHDAISPSAVVSACTYSSVEHTNTASTTFWSPALGLYDTLYARVTTRDGDFGSGYQCNGYKQYQVTQWTAHGTSGSYYSNVRAWTCGGYDGSWAAASSSVYSAQLYYPQTCGRQADDYTSSLYVYASGAYVSVYVNQG